MKNKEGNTNKKALEFETNFLKEKGEVSSSVHHKEYLGMDVPENFFINSKTTILNLVIEKKKTSVFYLRRSFQVAASIALLVVLSISLLLSEDTSIDSFDVAFDDTLFESLFIEEDNISEYVEGVLLSEIMVEAETSEQELENIFINSLFVEDSLLDSYTKKSLLNNIIL